MDTRSALAAVVRERSRVLAPALFLATLGYVGFAGPIGIRPSLPYHVVALIVTGVLGVVALLCARRLVPDRWIYAASAASWWCPVIATLLTQYDTHDIQLSYLLIVLIATAGVQLDTRLAIASLVIAEAVAIPLVLRDAGPHPFVLVSAVATSAVFAALIHVLMRRALVASVALQEQLLHAQRIEVAGTLAAGLAHDMNNVLASISMFTESALDEADPAERTSELRQVIAQAERGAVLTRGLLAFSRRGQYRKQVFVFQTAIDDAIAILSRTLPKGVELRVTATTGDVRIEGDPAQLGQVLLNLAVNAADAMAGHGTLHLTTSILVEPGRRCICVRVTDTGHGMDEATRARVFEPFFTTKPLGKGTGLGLAMVWGIVHNHGGTITVASRPGEGTTFTVCLPITDAPLPAAPPPVVAAAPERTARVLVVDDEAAVRAGTTRILTKAGLSVTTASNGAEALAAFAADPTIALVILDMAMPVMGGAECFARLRETSDVPVIVATGYAVDTEAQELRARGAALIEKPYRSADLVALVEQVLRR